jgi:hypothetical protein
MKLSSSLFGPDIPLSILVSDTLSLCSSVNLQDQVSHPYEYEIGVRGSVVGSGTVLKAGRWRVRFPLRSLDISADTILPAAL